MKLNKHQLCVLNAVKNAGKASYSQATADGGNGRTVGALLEQGLLAVHQPSRKVTHVTYSLTAEAKKALKEHAKQTPAAVA